MNRKGKKSPLIKVKNTKAEKAKPKHSLSDSKRRQFVAKPFASKQKRSKTKAVADNNPRLKKSLVAKKRSTPNTDRSKTINNSVKKSRGSLWLAVYAIIIVVGISTILGTIVSLATLETETATPQTASITTETTSDHSNSRLDNLFAISSLGKEIVPLRESLQQLAGQYPDLEPKVFVVDLDNKGFVSIQGEEIIASASTIKLPILVAFFQDVDQGKISLEERLIMTKDSIGGGSGTMQYQEPGTKFLALETASKMMIVSDNTATNMLIERMGGMQKLNRRFDRMGLKATRLRNPLPDLTGTNTTTAEDLGNLLAKIDNGGLISLRSRDRLLYIMRNLVRNTLLPVGLESEAIIAHKTGDIKSVLGDAGIIDMPSGKRYIASVLVKRPDNAPQAKEFIQKASGIIYQYFKPQTAAISEEEE